MGLSGGSGPPSASSSFRANRTRPENSSSSAVKSWRGSRPGDWEVAGVTSGANRPVPDIVTEFSSPAPVSGCRVRVVFNTPNAPRAMLASRFGYDTLSPFFGLPIIAGSTAVQNGRANHSIITSSGHDSRNNCQAVGSRADIAARSASFSLGSMLVIFPSGSTCSFMRTSSSERTAGEDDLIAAGALTPASRETFRSRAEKTRSPDFNVSVTWYSISNRSRVSDVVGGCSSMVTSVCLTMKTWTTNRSPVRRPQIVVGNFAGTTSSANICAGTMPSVRRHRQKATEERRRVGMKDLSMSRDKVRISAH